jgi:hypothetical protein
VLYAWNIASADFAPYYSVAVKSMAESWQAFFYGAFDPAATITGACHVPGGPSVGGRGAGAARGAAADADTDRRVGVRAPDGGRRANHVPGAGRRCLAAGGRDRTAALAYGVRGMGRAGLPGQDAASVDDPARAVHRLPGCHAAAGSRGDRPPRCRGRDRCAGERGGAATGHPAMAARGGRRRDAGRVAVVDPAVHGHPGGGPAVRGRVDAQQRVRDGLRL